MNQSVTKEIRDLLPMFVGGLLLIVGPFLIWHRAVGEACFITFGLACAILGGSSFGNEFQHRTFSLLLSQPIARSALWRQKMVVLGASIIISLVVAFVCWLIYRPRYGSPPWPLVWIALCAFCGAPFWTLLLRHEIGGMVFAIAMPAGLIMTCIFATEKLADPGQVWPFLGSCVLVIYLALVYGLGYVKFRRLQIVDGPGREIALPAGLEAILSRPLSGISARCRGPFAALLKKELRLQQTCFLLAGLFVLIAVGSACLPRAQREWSEIILAVDYASYLLILPLIAGAIAVAEEKGWDLAEWHLTLPPSALTQWWAKLLATLGTSWVLGLVLPTLVFLVGQSLLVQPGARTSLPPAPIMLCWTLGQLLLTSAAIYGATISRTTLRAILGTFAIVIAASGAFALAIHFATSVIRPRLSGHRFPPVQIQSDQHLWEALVSLLIAGGLCVLLCLLLWFAWSNFRRYANSAGNIIVQLVVIISSVWLISLGLAMAIFILESG